MQQLKVHLDLSRRYGAPRPEPLGDVLPRVLRGLLAGAALFGASLVLELAADELLEGRP